MLTQRAPAHMRASRPLPTCHQRACLNLQRHAPFPTHLHRTRPHIVVTSAGSFQATAQDFANNVNKNVMDFVEDQKLKEKAQEAAVSAQRTLKDAYAGAQDQARRMYTQIESQYGLSEKARKAGQRVAEAAQEAEQTYGIKGHVRVWLQNMQRRMPLLQKRLAEFGATPAGKVAMVAVFVMAVYSGVIWNLLHIMLLLWWLLLPLSLVMVGVAQRIQEQRFQEYQSQSQGRSSPMSTAARRYRQQSGPVIDAEWAPVDKKKK